MKRQVNTPEDFKLARAYADQPEQQSDPFAYQRALARLRVFGGEALEYVAGRYVLVIE